MNVHEFKLKYGQSSLDLLKILQDASQNTGKCYLSNVELMNLCPNLTHSTLYNLFPKLEKENWVLRQTEVKNFPFPHYKRTILVNEYPEFLQELIKNKDENPFFNDEKLYTAKEMAETLGVSQSYISLLKSRFGIKETVRKSTRHGFVDFYNEEKLDEFRIRIQKCKPRPRKKVVEQTNDMAQVDLLNESRQTSESDEIKELKEKIKKLERQLKEKEIKTQIENDIQNICVKKNIFIPHEILKDIIDYIFDREEK